MSKKEFLEKLRLELTGEVPEEEIISQGDYYDRFITKESYNKAEEDVIEELGNPRIIAKTIIDAYERAYGPVYKNIRNRYDKRKWDQDGYGPKPNDSQRTFNNDSAGKNTNTIKRYVNLIVIFLILLVLLMLTIFLGTVIMGVIIKLIPIVIVAFLVLFIVRKFKDL